MMMKKLKPLFFFAFFISLGNIILAQEYASVSNEDYVANRIENNHKASDLPQWSNVDTIPDFEANQNKLKITGTIFEKDGVTPAKNVVLSIYQTNQAGDFVLVKGENNEKEIYHSATIKTGEDGQYTFYTFVPGTTHRSNELKKIHTNVKEPGKEEYGMYAFVFDNDPLLKKHCRNRLAKRGIDTILKFETEKENDINVATKNIILIDNINE